MSELDRIRWHCRRGMLELDLMLARFLECYGDRLQADDLDNLEELLEYPDNELLDLLMSRATLSDPRCQPILDLMRHA